MSFTDVRKAMAEQAIDAGPLPCHWCGTPTERATLSSYGARCGSCYAEYCRATRAAPQRSSYASALMTTKNLVAKPVPLGVFRPIADDVLPPGMRSEA